MGWTLMSAAGMTILSLVSLALPLFFRGYGFSRLTYRLDPTLGFQEVIRRLKWNRRVAMIYRPFLTNETLIEETHYEALGLYAPHSRYVELDDKFHLMPIEELAKLADTPCRALAFEESYALAEMMSDTPQQAAVQLALRPQTCAAANTAFLALNSTSERVRTHSRLIYDALLNLLKKPPAERAAAIESMLPTW